MAATAAHAEGAAAPGQAKPWRRHGATAPPAPRRRSQGGIQAPGAPGTAGSSDSVTLAPEGVEAESSRSLALDRRG